MSEPRDINIEFKKLLTESKEFTSKQDFRSHAELEASKKEAELKNAEKKLNLALSTYKKLFIAICCYVVLVLVILSINYYYIKLSDSVLITLLTTTTTNILGVFYIASKWLYFVEARSKKNRK